MGACRNRGKGQPRPVRSACHQAGRGPARALRNRRRPRRPDHRAAVPRKRCPARRLVIASCGGHDPVERFRQPTGTGSMGCPANGRMEGVLQHGAAGGHRIHRPQPSLHAIPRTVADGAGAVGRFRVGCTPLRRHPHFDCQRENLAPSLPAAVYHRHTWRSGSARRGSPMLRFLRITRTKTSMVAAGQGA